MRLIRQDERLTRDVVDELLALYPERDCQCTHHLTPRHDAHDLAAEVRALRAEIERWRVAGEKITASSKALMAALARVEALVAEFELGADRERDRPPGSPEHSDTETGTTLRYCANRLQSALRGEL